MGNCIDFENDILKNERSNKGEPRVYYILSKYKDKRSYYIMKDISEHVTLVQLTHSFGNVNHAISVLGCWIFDLNYTKVLVLNRELLDMNCAPSVDEEQVAVFETVFTELRYICSTAH